MTSIPGEIVYPGRSARRGAILGDIPILSSTQLPINGAYLYTGVVPVNVSQFTHIAVYWEYASPGSNPVNFAMVPVWRTDDASADWHIDQRVANGVMEPDEITTASGTDATFWGVVTLLNPGGAPQFKMRCRETIDDAAPGYLALFARAF